MICVLPFLNNPKNLDPSFKMDLEFWDCFRRKKTLSYNLKNTINITSRVDFLKLNFCKGQENWKNVGSRAREIVGFAGSGPIFES